MTYFTNDRERRKLKSHRRWLSVGFLGRKKPRVNGPWGGRTKESGGMSLEPQSETENPDIPQDEGLVKLTEEIVRDSNQVGS